jgi:hypothetical protein
MKTAPNTTVSAAGHKQVKVSVETEIAEAFKEACLKCGVSMAGELSRFMAEYGGTAEKRSPPPSDEVATRKQRRKWISRIIDRMERIRDAETRYYDNFPENLRTSAACESSEDSIGVIEDAIELLTGIYGR